RPRAAPPADRDPGARALRPARPVLPDRARRVHRRERAGRPARDLRGERARTALRGAGSLLRGPRRLRSGAALSADIFHAASAEVAVDAEEAFDYLSDGLRQGEWTLGS